MEGIPGAKFRLVRTRRRREPVRRAFQFMGTVVSQDYRVHSGDVQTLSRGLLERVLFNRLWSVGEEYGFPPEPDSGLVERLLAGVAKRLDSLAFGLTPMSREKFIETRLRRKRAVYERALVNLQRRGLQPRDAVVASFVKAEKINFTKKVDPVPRIIQPRRPEYNIELGVYIAPLEKVMYRSLAKMVGYPVVMKGFNALQQGALFAADWAAISNPVAVGLDVRRLDQHTSATILQWEHARYDAYYHSRRLRWLLKMQLTTEGMATCYDGYIKYRVGGVRCSGDMNTGLGNCVNVSSIVLAWSEHYDVTLRLKNNGDDCVVILSQCDLVQFISTIQGWFENFAMKITVEQPAYRLEHVEFCQTRPVYNGRVWTMVRDPRVCMDKDMCSLKPIRNERDWNTLRNTVGLSGLALAGHMPVFNEFYAALRRNAGERIDKDEVESGFKMLAKGMNMSRVPVTDTARVSFFMAFDISPMEQLAIEEHLSKLMPVWEDPVLRTGRMPEGVLASLTGSCS